MARSISTNRVRLGAQLVVMVRTSKLHATERVDLNRRTANSRPWRRSRVFRRNSNADVRPGVVVAAQMSAAGGLPKFHLEPPHGRIAPIAAV